MIMSHKPPEANWFWPLSKFFNKSCIAFRFLTGTCRACSDWNVRATTICLGRGTSDNGTLGALPTELHGHNSRGRIRTCDHPIFSRSNRRLHHRPSFLLTLLCRVCSAGQAGRLSHTVPANLWSGNKRSRLGLAPMGIRTPQPEGCSAVRSIRGQTPLTLYVQLCGASLRWTGAPPVPNGCCCGKGRPRLV